MLPDLTAGWRSAASPRPRWPTRGQGAVRPPDRRGRGQRRRGGRLPRPQPDAIRRRRDPPDGWRAPAAAAHRWRRCGPRSPRTCAAPLGAAPSGCGSTNAAPRWCGWPRLRAPGDPRQPDHTHRH
ncbi:putative malonyl CoA-acyl carrier protein transacylase, FabD2 [Mycobacterium xenopi 3993]|nr:putative malonyl CoA-acyl carrier protein transacylase, FabD2 [Mycobacterium xenopi 3993]